MWRPTQIPARRGSSLLLMPVQMRTWKPSKVWPLEEEQGPGAGAGPSKSMEVVVSSPKPKTQEVVMVIEIETGRQAIRMRVADGRSEREKQVGRNVCEEVDGEEQETRRAKPTVGEQLENFLEPGKKGQDR